jgi:cytochrome c553
MDTKTTLRSTRRHWPLLIALGLCSLSAIATAAEDPERATTARAERLAITVCGTCHGAMGVSAQPKFPNLAAQNADYLAAELEAFKSQSRGDPDAISYMWGMSAYLDADTMRALADRYAALPPPRLKVADPSLIATGRTLYENGLPDAGVPACGACHGPDGHGLPGFPRLAGQHAQYVLKQLRSFQSNMRNVAVMHGVAAELKITQMRAVAAFIESQP